MSHDPKRLPLLRSFFSFPFLEEDFCVPSDTTTSGLSVSEEEEKICVEAHLPGLKPEEIEVSCDNGILWIHGEKKEEQENKKKRYYRRAARSFSYQLQVPGDADEGKEPEATYKDGVVKVTFVKRKESKPKKIAIKLK